MVTTRHLRILVLGGTSFLGRAIVSASLGAGHETTLFNRGITNPELFPDVEKLRGNRDTDLSALADREWDAVIDVAAYHPDTVTRSVACLRDRVAQYIFVSTVSVYADHSTVDAQREDAPLLENTAASDPGEQYGARKAACERTALDAFGANATIVRAGLIVGPHDRTTRFVHWPRRFADGGQILAPGQPDDRVQFIDVRDLAEWILHAAVTNVAGVFNVTGPSIPFAALLDACRVPTIATDVVWIPTRELLAAGLDPWMGIPLWIGAQGWEAANTIDISRAVDAGLTIRPLRETIAGALEFPGDDGHSPFPRETERDLLNRLTGS
jgi:2'-hydroxyisoflavone reductase